MFHEEINNINALHLSIILYTALFKENLFNAVTNVNVLILKFSYTYNLRIRTI